MPDATLIAAPPRRRWYQYSLRTLFIVITLICVAMGLYVAPKVRRHNLVLAIEAAGGRVVYAEPPAGEPWLSKLLREHVPRDWCDEIIVVDLDGTDACDATLAGFETLSGLRQLRLNGTQVTNAGLAHLEPLSGLWMIMLHRTHVSDAGLKHLHGLTGLRVLSLGSTRVTDAGLVYLQGLTGLEDIVLDDTLVTAAGLVKLKRLTGLRELVLYDCDISDTGVADLQKNFPACYICRPTTTRRN